MKSTVLHNGSELSFKATLDSDTTPGVIHIEFEDGRKSRISVDDLRFCMPSCEGTVMAVLCSQRVFFYDTITGKELSREQLCQLPAHFYL